MAMSLVRPAHRASTADRHPDRSDMGPWHLLGPDRMVELRRPRRTALRPLPSGTPVCLVLDGVASRWRLRRLARRAGITVERELIAVPSTAAPLVIHDDAAEPVMRLWTSVATVPPGIARGWLVATVGLRLAARLPWEWSGGLLPGRVLIGRAP
jgi:hypothetical protein